MVFTNTTKNLFLVTVVLIFVITPYVAKASDDSNNGNLTTTTQINVNQLVNTLNVLSQNVNDTYLKQLIKNLENEIQSGNNSPSVTLCTFSNSSSVNNCQNGGAISDLSRIKSYIDSNKQQVPGSLYSLLNSLYVNNEGVFLNETLLQQLLNLSSLNQYGVPRGLENETPQQASIDLQTLASLLSTLNPDLVAQMLNLAAGIKVSQGTIPSVPVQAGPIPISNIPISPVEPVMGPSYPYYLIPVLVLITIIIIFRGKISSLLGSQRIPEDVYFDMGKVIEFPRTNRDKIIQTFQKAIHLMVRRGIRKMIYETHREFSNKLASHSVHRDFSKLAELYEKAKFSGIEVNTADVIEAQQAYTRLEET
jgi:hypothetical protein